MRCPYELTWEYLSGNEKVKWLNIQHFRNEGVTFLVTRVGNVNPDDD